MPQIPTKSHTPPRADPPPVQPLSASQERALDALVAGESITEAARQAHVDRSTVHRWLSRDDRFRAGVNAARRELRETAQRKLEALAGKALEVVANALDTNDAKTALRILDGLGMLTGERPTIGSEDPEALAGERAEQAAMANVMRDLRRSMAGQ